MLIDDKTEHRPPPEYSEVIPSPNDDAPSTSASSVPQRIARKQSVLYESDMEDPFSNRAAANGVAGPSSSPLAPRRRESDGFFGNGTNVLPPPDAPVSGYISGSGGASASGSRLRPVSPHSYEYVPSTAVGTATGAYGDQRKSYGMSTDGARTTYYDSEYEHASLHSSPTQDLGDSSPLVNRNQPKDTSSANLIGNDVEARQRGVQQLDYQDPYGPSSYSEGVTPPAPDKKSGFFDKVFGDTALRHPVEQRIENRRRGVTRQLRPFLCWVLSAAMVGVLIYELVYNQQQQHSLISLKPYVNPMLGPSQVGLISLGARWPACMRDVDSIPLTMSIGCPSNTDNPPTKLCSIEQICAFGGFHDKTPNQWWRFITPIFLHAGIIHLIFNLFAQLTISAQVEREIGSIAFLILYFTAGIFGNVLGGNFALVGLPSVGASGAIFGTVGVLWVDLLAHWGIERQPGKKLLMLCIDLIVGVALGYIPGVDNFVHLGGFLAGLICAAIFLPVISTTRTHKSVMWAVRIAMIPLGIVLFVVLIRNFYKSNPFAACNWCRYLSCIPTSANNRCRGNGLTITTTST